MEYSEQAQDLFAVPESYSLAHCISADAEMGAGIAKAFASRFPELSILKEAAPENKVGSCIRVGRVLNLITKEKYWQKPTYESVESALQSMLSVCKAEGIKKVAMPRIGSGLDKLDWPKVSALIQKVFTGSGVEILVCVKLEK